MYSVGGMYSTHPLPIAIDTQQQQSHLMTIRNTEYQIPNNNTLSILISIPYVHTYFARYSKE